MAFSEKENNQRTESAKGPRLRPPALAFALLAALACGGLYYYRANVLPEKYFARAEDLFVAGDYAGACLLYQKITRLRPDRRGLFYRMGCCREKLGDAGGALSYYEEHLKHEPSDITAMVRLGWLYMERRDFEAALKWLREAAKREKKDAALWRLTADAAR